MDVVIMNLLCHVLFRILLLHFNFPMESNIEVC